MNLHDAINVLSEELVESHVRNKYPYVLTCGNCAVNENNQPEAGVYALLSSEVFGRIDDSSALSLEEVFIELALALIQNRDERSAKEISSEA